MQNSIRALSVALFVTLPASDAMAQSWFDDAFQFQPDRMEAIAMTATGYGNMDDMSASDRVNFILNTIFPGELNQLADALSVTTDDLLGKHRDQLLSEIFDFSKSKWIYSGTHYAAQTIPIKGGRFAGKLLLVVFGKEAMNMEYTAVADNESHAYRLLSHFLEPKGANGKDGVMAFPDGSGDERSGLPTLRSFSVDR